MSEATLSQPKSSELTVLWLVYVLYFLGPPAIVGFSINYYEIKKYKRLKLEGNNIDLSNYEFYDSHHQWLLRTFILAFLLVLAAIGTIYYGAGLIIAVLAAIWWFYRIIKGVVYLAKNRVLPLDYSQN